MIGLETLQHPNKLQQDCGGGRTIPGSSVNLPGSILHFHLNGIVLIEKSYCRIRSIRNGVIRFAFCSDAILPSGPGRTERDHHSSAPGRLHAWRDFSSRPGGNRVLHFMLRIPCLAAACFPELAPFVDLQVRARQLSGLPMVDNCSSSLVCDRGGYPFAEGRIDGQSYKFAE